MDQRPTDADRPDASAQDAGRVDAIEDAVASAAALMLRHRLFPRAMAWNVHQSVERGADASPTAAHGRELPPRFPTASHAASPAAQARHQALAMANAALRGDPRTLNDVARSFPLLQATETALRGGVNGVPAVDATARPHEPARASEGLSQHREKLLRTVGKYLGDGDYAPRAVARPSAPRPYSGRLSADGATAMTLDRLNEDEDPQHAAFQAMKISTYSDEEGDAARLTPPARPAGHAAGRSSSSPSPSQSSNTDADSVESVQAAPAQNRSPATRGGKKRQRSGAARRERVDPVSMVFPKTTTPIAPSLARALLTGYGAKRCSVDQCGKIAVSKGLCRGHGGGRRCQFPNCTKCAQSRSPFCWAHGGGKRCEAPGCRRSRKTKRFCVDHVEMENTVPLPAEGAAPASAIPSPVSTRPSSSSGELSAHGGAADSDDSVGGRSTVTSDSDVSSVYASSKKENRPVQNVPDAAAGSLKQRSFSFGSDAMHRQEQQDAGEQTGTFAHHPAQHAPYCVAAPALQLPSLSEALQRAVPPNQSVDARFPSSAAPSSYVYREVGSSAVWFAGQDHSSTGYWPPNAHP